jgi:chemotaxis signal transduction protein
MTEFAGAHPEQAHVAATTTDAAAISPELQRVFAERARRLAQPFVHSGDNAGDHQVLVFTIDGERYAIDGRRVVEVHPVGRISPVPGTATFWMGVINLRGRLYAVLDMGRLLTQMRLHVLSDVSTRGAQGDGQLVLATAADVTVALFVDEVLTVRKLTQRELLPPIADSQEGDRRAVVGITEDLVVVLDLASVLQQVQPGVQPDAQSGVNV